MQLHGIFSTVYDLTRLYEEERKQEAEEKFTGPVYEGTDFVDTVISNTLIRQEEQADREKKKVTKNRFLKIGAISVAGLVLLSNIK